MNQSTTKKLFLLDSMGLIYRSYFALQKSQLVTSKGENVSAVFGFLKSIFRVIDEQQPDFLAAAFDTPEPTFRHRIFPEYKATRQKMPEELSEQLPRVRQALDVLNIPIIEVPGLEADDVMGILARMAEQQNIETYLVTGDKDFMQLVSDKIKIYNPKKAGEEVEILDAAGVKEKIGVPPEQVIEYYSLTGDSSDNVPGVPNVGPKTAKGLLQQFKNLDEIYLQLHKITPQRIRTQLANFKDQAYLSRKLVTIDVTTKIAVNIESLSLKEPDRSKAFDLMKELEFNSLLSRFTVDQTTSTVKYNTITDTAQLKQFIEQLGKQTNFTIDLETTDVDPMKAEIVGLSFSWREAEAYYLPIDVSGGKGSGDLFDKQEFQGFPLQEVKPMLRPILENSEIKKNGQNIKYDLTVLARSGLEVAGVDFDTMVASYLIDPSLRQHNLDALSLLYFNYQKVATKELIGSGKKQITMAEVPLEKISFYACEDADFTQRLRTVLEPKLIELELKPLFDEVELPLLAVLMEMERNGVSLDVPFLEKMSRELDASLKQSEAKIYQIAGLEFNINSPKQLAEVLFTKLGLPVIRRSKTGPSTDVSVLESLAKDHQLPKEILEFRQLSKLKSTYVDALPKLVNAKTGRVHTSYNQTVAATGRLSSSDPNLQNIPIRTDIGRKIRRAFVPADGNHVLIDADYSQIELRIMAHLAQDASLIQSFQQEADIHRSTAALIFNVAPEEVTDDMRRRAKEVNFGIMYGMGAFGLAARLDIEPAEAETFIANYFASYPGIQQFMQESIELARKNGFVKTMLNRRRYLPDIHSENRQMREFAERNAINTRIQGTAADLIKVAMINISKKFKQEKIATKMILQVHDELVFEAPKTEIETAKSIVRYEMENAIKLTVPIKVEIGVGENWLEAH